MCVERENFINCQAACLLIFWHMMGDIWEDEREAVFRLGNWSVIVYDCDLNFISFLFGRTKEQPQ